MAELSGLSFSPGLSRRWTQTLAGSSPLTPSQSAVLQIISTRLPGFIGGVAPAPDMLLRRPLGSLRPDLAVRNQIAPPQAAISTPADQEPVTAPPPSPLTSPSVVSPLSGFANLFAPNPFGGPVRDVGPSAPNDSGLNFVFGKHPGSGYDDGSANVPPPPAYGGPGQPAGPPSAGSYSPWCLQALTVL